MALQSNKHFTQHYIIVEYRKSAWVCYTTELNVLKCHSPQQWLNHFHLSPSISFIVLRSGAKLICQLIKDEPSSCAIGFLILAGSLTSLRRSHYIHFTFERYLFLRNIKPLMQHTWPNNTSALKSSKAKTDQFDPSCILQGQEEQALGGSEIALTLGCQGGQSLGGAERLNHL